MPSKVISKIVGVLFLSLLIPIALEFIQMSVREPMGYFMEYSIYVQPILVGFVADVFVFALIGCGYLGFKFIYK